MAETVTFDGNDLAQISGLGIYGFDPHQPANRQVNSNPLAAADKSSVNSAYYKDRKIHVLATLSRSSKADLQTGLRDLEKLLQTQEGLLVGSIAGVSTQFTATKSNIATTFLAGGLADLDIEFFCSDPMGYDVSSTTLYSYSHLVGSAYSFAVSWAGNVKQQPVITITLNSLLSGTSKTITIGNSTTTEAVSILTDWANSDILIVNSKTKTITLNGDPIDYTGKIPEWEESQPITYADDLGARDIAVNITYQVRNL